MDKIVRKNNYNGKIYNYYSHQLDNSPKWDQKIHKNTDIKFQDYEKLQCGYCGVFFQSRNKLFTHLGFMDIDIRPLFDQVMMIDNIVKEYAVNIRLSEERKRIREYEEYYKKKFKY